MDPFRLEESDFPSVHHVYQSFDATRVDDIPGTVRSELERIDLAGQLRPGMRVAITAGSRGVVNIPIILRAVADFLSSKGARPVVLPTMGSHGGATADGQKEMLSYLGVTEESVGCPILSTMEVVQIGQTEHGCPVYLDKNAAECDGIVVVGRVKQHTDFDGTYESGLLKMMAIGLGKHVGAIAAHRYTVTLGWAEIMPAVGKVTLRNQVTPILAGLAIVENAYDETAIIEALLPDQIEKREPELLDLARYHLGRLPFDQIDVLLVNEAGKDISGDGMDPNVTGRILFVNATRPATPRITRIVLRDLTEATHGNALGIGQAEFVTRRLANKIDWHPTYTNGLTGMGPEYARLPIVCEHDLQALSWAFHTSGRFPPRECRLAWIQNTLNLTSMYVSEALLEEARQHPRLRVSDESRRLQFDSEGYLLNLLS